MTELITLPDNELLNDSYPQRSLADTDWTDEEREAMRERGFDDLDILRAWLS